MANVKGKASSSSETSGSSSSLAVFSRFKWHELIAIPLVAVGVAIYWFRSTLLDWYFTGQDQVLSYLGLGLVLLAIWLAVFVFAAGLRRRWFRHYRVWLGSVALLALSFGIMSFFKPLTGSLAWFSLYGEVSLGGIVGEIIAGPIAWQAILRLIGIAILGFAIVTPTLALDTGLTILRSVVYSYVAFVLFVKWIGRMYRRDEKAASPGYEIQSSRNEEYSDVIASEYEPSNGGARSPSAWDLVPSNGGDSRSRTPDYQASIVSTTPSPIYDPDEDEAESFQETNGFGDDERNPKGANDDIFETTVDLDSNFESIAPPQYQDSEPSIVIEPSVSFRETDGNDDEVENKFNKFWGGEELPSEPVYEEQEEEEGQARTL